MNAKLTAENNPVWVSPKISTEWTRSNQIAHEGERRAEIFVVLLRIVSVKRVGFLMIDGGGGSTWGYRTSMDQRTPRGRNEDRIKLASQQQFERSRFESNG